MAPWIKLPPVDMEGWLCPAAPAASRAQLSRICTPGAKETHAGTAGPLFREGVTLQKCGFGQILADDCGNKREEANCMLPIYIDNNGCKKNESRSPQVFVTRDFMVKGQAFLPHMAFIFLWVASFNSKT